MESPQYYMYSYESSGTAPEVGQNFTAYARGDLDADGILSEFSISGKIQGQAPDIVLTIAPAIREVNPLE